MSFGVELIPYFDRGSGGFDDRIYLATFSIGFISFIYFCISSFIAGEVKSILLIVFSLIIGLSASIASGRYQALFSLQFWIFLYMIKSLINKHSHENLKEFCLNISLTFFIFQLTALINSYFGEFSAIVPGHVIIYNYEQYYSFGVIIGLYFVSHFGLNILGVNIYYLVSLLGAIDAENFSAIYLLIFYPIIRVAQYFFKKYKFSFNIRLLYSSIIFFIVAGIPFFVLILNVYFPLNYNPEMLGGRGAVFMDHFSKFDFISLIVPKVFYEETSRDPHNTYLNFAITFGYFTAAILLVNIVFHIKSLSFRHAIFVVPFFSVTLALTEPLQHQYTAGLLALFVALLSRLSILESSSVQKPSSN